MSSERAHTSAPLTWVRGRGVERLDTIVSTGSPPEMPDSLISTPFVLPGAPPGRSVNADERPPSPRSAQAQAHPPLSGRRGGPPRPQLARTSSFGRLGSSESLAPTLPHTPTMLQSAAMPRQWIGGRPMLQKISSRAALQSLLRVATATGPLSGLIEQDELSGGGNEWRRSHDDAQRSVKPSMSRRVATATGALSSLVPAEDLVLGQHRRVSTQRRVATATGALSSLAPASPPRGRRSPHPGRLQRAPRHVPVSTESQEDETDESTTPPPADAEDVFDHRVSETTPLAAAPPVNYNSLASPAGSLAYSTNPSPEQRGGSSSKPVRVPKRRPPGQ